MIRQISVLLLLVSCSANPGSSTDTDSGPADTVDQQGETFGTGAEECSEWVCDIEGDCPPRLTCNGEQCVDSATQTMPLCFPKLDCDEPCASGDQCGPDGAACMFGVCFRPLGTPFCLGDAPCKVWTCNPFTSENNNCPRGSTCVDTGTGGQCELNGVPECVPPCVLTPCEVGKSCPLGGQCASGQDFCSDPSTEVPGAWIPACVPPCVAPCEADGDCGMEGLVCDVGVCKDALGNTGPLLCTSLNG